MSRQERTLTRKGKWLKPEPLQSTGQSIDICGCIGKYEKSFNDESNVTVAFEFLTLLLNHLRLA